MSLASWRSAPWARSSSTHYSLNKSINKPRAVQMYCSLSSHRKAGRAQKTTYTEEPNDIVSLINGYLCLCSSSIKFYFVSEVTQAINVQFGHKNVASFRRRLSKNVVTVLAQNHWKQWSWLQCCPTETGGPFIVVIYHYLASLCDSFEWKHHTFANSTALQRLFSLVRMKNPWWPYLYVQNNARPSRLSMQRNFLLSPPALGFVDILSSFTNSGVKPVAANMRSAFE